MTKFRGLLFDLDGVFFVGDQLLPGACETLELLRSRRIPFRIITNTTTCSRATLIKRVRGMGLPLEIDDLINAAHAATLYLRALERPRCRFVVCPDTRTEFAEFADVKDKPDYIVLGDIEDQVDYALLNSLFNQIMNGAELIALHKGRFWQTTEGLKVDLGLFVAGLEFATGRTATVIGKPSPMIFAAALREMGVAAADCAMIGDDLHNDVGGAQSAGIRGILTRTGKYRPGYENSGEVRPDHIIDSLAELWQLV